MSLGAGTRLGPYEILALLGAGAMGEVYRAKDTRLAREVAIKVLPEEFFEGEERRQRFQREAKLLAALNHPNIAAVHSFEEIPASSSATRHLLVMELLEGTTLRDKLDAGRIPLKEAVAYAVQIAKGLSAAHDKGIVHRDLKPANLFVTKGGQLKILDFGLAKRAEPDDPDEQTGAPTESQLTEPGTAVGTLAYMSPEQVRGIPVDHRSDIFSLGSILYELLSSRKAFRRGSPADTMGAILRDEPPDLGDDVPPALVHVVGHCLEKDREDRFQSARDIVFALSEASQESSAERLRVPPPTPRRNRALAAALLLVLVAGGAFLLSRFGTRRPAAGPASPVRLSISFPPDAAPRDTGNFNPLALSPDGKVLVYSGNTLLVRALDREEIRAIPGTEGAVSPFFSPDGHWVGFFAEGRLKKVALAGGQPITICSIKEPGRGGYGSGTWGTDGTIAFMPSFFSGLQCIPASGGDARALTTVAPEGLESHNFPQILPDGEHVLFQIEAVGPHSVPRASVVSLRTGAQRVVAEDAAYPRYLPSGHLVFTRKGSLLAAPFSLKRLEVSGLAVPVVDDLLTNRPYSRAAYMAFASDGKLVYTPRASVRRTLVWMDRTGTEEPLPFPARRYLETALSPDGTRVASIVAENDESLALLIGDLTRGTQTRVPVDGFFQHLAWTPDGTRIAVDFAGTAQDLGRLNWFRADGSAPREPLTPETSRRHETPTSFSADGRLLLFDVLSLADAEDAGWEIRLLPLGGGKPESPLIRTRFDAHSGCFSPDGRWVAYQSNESERDEIFVRPFPGPGAKWQISAEGGSRPRWSRNGRELFFRNRDMLMAVAVETSPVFRAGRPRMLFERPLLESYDPWPDGARFLMIKRDPAESSAARVTVVLNWFDEVSRRVAGSK